MRFCVESRGVNRWNLNVNEACKVTRREDAARYEYCNSKDSKGQSSEVTIPGIDIMELLATIWNC